MVEVSDCMLKSGAGVLLSMLNIFDTGGIFFAFRLNLFFFFGYLTVNGLHFFPFFKWRENVQKLESSQQETTTITNSVRAASDGTEAGSHGNTTSESGSNF